MSQPDVCAPKTRRINSMRSLIMCLEVKVWMALNCLHFNYKKTAVMVFGPGITNGSSPVALGPFTQYMKHFVTNPWCQNGQ